MNLRTRNKPVVDILFLLALFCVFLISALFIVLFGAKIYRSTVSNMDQNFNSRTAVSYLTQKARSHDQTGGIQVKRMDGRDVLILSEEANGRTYLTYLYENDGFLCELTAEDTYAFHFIGGTQILAVDGFTAEAASASLYRIAVTTKDGQRNEFFLAGRSDGAAGEEETYEP